MSPKISIVIPVYNVEKFLSKCIQSITQQNFEDIEIILINDGSTDNSLNICYDFAHHDNRIKVFTTENRGVSHARNIGIQQAKGEYIWFIDSDDLIEKQSLKILYTTAINNKLDFLQFGFDRITDDYKYNYKVTINKHQNNIIYPSGKEFFNKNLSEYNSTWRTLFRTQIIKQNNISFIETIKRNEDNLFTLTTLFYCKNCQCIKDILYHYTINSTTISSCRKKTSDCLQVCYALIDLSKKIPFYKERNNNSIIEYIFDMTLNGDLPKKTIHELLVKSNFTKYTGTNSWVDIFYYLLRKKYFLAYLFINTIYLPYNQILGFLSKSKHTIINCIRR